MIKGDMYRPTVLIGKSFSNNYCLGKLIFNSSSDKKEDKIQVLLSNNLARFSEGYQGYLFENNVLPDNIINYLKKSQISFLTEVKNINTLVNNDIVEIIPSKNTIKVLFRANSGDNALVVTNNCNCNCIICPDSLSTRQGVPVSFDKIINLVRLIDRNTKFLCITGGEPTLLEDKLFIVLNECKNKLPTTNFTFLTNARMFAYENYAREFNLHRPRHIIMGVPVYGHIDDIHDSITNTTGSFTQTVNGIKNLLNLDIAIEIRTVVSKLNYKYLYDLSNYIIKQFPNVLRVNIMGLEMLGNAIVNKENVWINYNEIRDIVREASLNLIKNGIETYLYNFPLCFVDENLWSITIKSISDYKVRYFDECEKCKVKVKCGGFFYSTINVNGLQINPIL